MAYDIAGARAAGYSDEEIESFLSDQYDVAGARSAGYTLDEIAAQYQPRPQQPKRQIDAPVSQIDAPAPEPVRRGPGGAGFEEYQARRGDRFQFTPAAKAVAKPFQAVARKVKKGAEAAEKDRQYYRDLGKRLAETERLAIETGRSPEDFAKLLDKEQRLALGYYKMQEAIAPGTALLSSATAAAVPFGRSLLSESQKEARAAHPAAAMTGEVLGTVAQTALTAGVVADKLGKIARVAKSPLLKSALTRTITSGGITGVRSIEDVAAGRKKVGEAILDTIQSAGAGAISVIPEVVAPANAWQLLAQPLGDLIYDAGIDAARGKDVLSADWLKEEAIALAMAEGFAAKDVLSGQEFRAEQTDMRKELRKWLKGRKRVRLVPGTPVEAPARATESTESVRPTEPPPEPEVRPKAALGPEPTPEATPEPTLDVPRETPAPKPLAEAPVEPPRQTESEAIRITDDQTQPVAVDPGSEFSPRQESVNKFRERLGLDEMSSPRLVSEQENLKAAQDQGIPARAMRIAQDVLENPRPLDPVESAGLTIKMAKLLGEDDVLQSRISASTDDAEISTLAAEANRVRDEFDVLSQAVHKSGSERGRYLQAQKLRIDADFQRIPVLARAKAAKGSRLDAKQEARFNRMVKKLNDTETRMKTLEQQLAEVTAKDYVRDVGRKKYGKMSAKNRQVEYTTKVKRIKELLAAGCS